MSFTTPRPRQGFGIPGLDARLGGGLLPGTLTVIAGATGIGKTQLALAWADAGLRAIGEGRRGIICDLTSRGDAQNHAAYARELYGWSIVTEPVDSPVDLEAIRDMQRRPGDYFHPFARAGRRVTRRDLEHDEWHAWKTDLARVLRQSAGFLYANLVRGTRRIVFDGIEPSDRMSESIQFEFFEYVYHQVIRRDDEWAARELFREHYRASENWVHAHRYDQASVGCVYLYTTPHVLLDDLMAQPIGEGDVFTNANTVILMGRTRHEGRMGRAFYVAKHRGSACSDEVVPFRISDCGIELIDVIR
jgi:KaiC/GvpD/RAD55 family RecA-like ATPase